jgi:hypothetical protein
MRVLSELDEEARALSERLSHISDEEVASIIREDRGERGSNAMYLLDAGSIVNLVKKCCLKPLAEEATLDLAIYGALNAV